MFNSILAAKRALGHASILLADFQATPQQLQEKGWFRLFEGFPLVPDFSGTAHAYCGSTLEAAIGDLLPWDRRSTRDDALRGYIIKSRATTAEGLLIVQPYSPALFAQGDLKSCSAATP